MRAPLRLSLVVSLAVSLAALLVCALPLSACGGALVSGRLSDLEKRLSETQARALTSQQKVDELENRVFLLTDQVESQKVAQTRRAAPRLPVVTLAPSGTAQPDSEENTFEERKGEIEFQGAARSTDATHARPLLHLSGEAPVRRAARSTAPVTGSTVKIDSSSDDLGIAKVPPIAAGLGGANSGMGVAERAPVEAESLRIYRTAYQDLSNGKHGDAARGFREFLRRYPHHDYADNAQYWLGECFYDQKQFTEAASEFRTVVARYPAGNKAPDAMLKLGFCLIALGETHKAKELLAQLPSSYPRTDAARLAEHRLADLKESSEK